MTDRQHNSGVDRPLGAGPVESRLHGLTDGEPTQSNPNPNPMLPRIQPLLETEERRLDAFLLFVQGRLDLGLSCVHSLHTDIDERTVNKLKWFY